MEREQQYIVTYDNKNTLEWLRNNFSVTYKSPVLNVVFLDTKYNAEYLLSLDGIISATRPTRGRLLNNKQIYKW